MERAAGNDFDVIIIGAGISGINAAYRLQTQASWASYTILEARGGMGGTWDLFKYPGIRSDSDLYTFGFTWRPWMQEKAFADGPSILQYIKESAAIHGIDRKIQFNHKLVAAEWFSDRQSWKLSIKADGEDKFFYGRFLVMATGYYDYDDPLPAAIPGIESFKGAVVHPQFWPEDLDYASKKIVVVGSGATAVTLLPSLAEKASRVTMLQRSPGYMLSLPSIDPTSRWARKWLPSWLAYRILRIKFLLLPFLFFKFCRRFPNTARSFLRRGAIKQLPKTIPHDPHFEPTYDPWEQRMCVCPGGDFYKALRSGRAAVATGHIKSVTEDGILLESGQKLDADIIVTATGLKIQMAGGARVYVDGEKLGFSDKFLWKSIMIQDLPNTAFIIGYTNASWTLGADATAQFIARLLNYMKKNGITAAVPRLEDQSAIKRMPILNLNSTYLKRAMDSMPKAGDKAPWRPRASYFSDLWQARFGNITTGLQLYRVSA
jgi:cation diffusion facilitator CzcD-associated flavoprotein CzcO